MKRSAGLLLYRRRESGVEVLLGHPGGPLFAHRDEKVWSIPKGEYGEQETPLAAAYREFAEEIGSDAPEGVPVPLGEVRLRSGKLVVAWALEGDFDPADLRSNEFTMHWPPRSGRFGRYPELDRVAWLDLDTARVKIGPGQVPLLDSFAELVELLER